MEFKKGDTVKLKSGGPRMTVKAVGAFPSRGIDQGVSCTWFQGNDLREEVFELETLETYTDPGPARVTRM